MRHLSRYAGIAAMIAASISCGDVVRDGRSPVFLVIDSLNGGSVLLSDVVKVVTTGATCTPAAPCFTVFNDMASVSLSSALKDVTASSSLGATAPTTNNAVTITRYHVTFRRADGRNTQGVDVPFAFDGAMTGTVPGGGSFTFSFEIVRHVAKDEAPLFQLRNSDSTISTIAEVTFFGADRVGNAISVTGTMTVNFGNFADQ